MSINVLLSGIKEIVNNYFNFQIKVNVQIQLIFKYFSFI